MSRLLQIRRAGPGLSVQDQGRRGYLAQGLSRGGAADLLALEEGAALLGQSAELAALEMIGMGGHFTASEDMRIALSGAPMRASLDGRKLAWNASHLLPAGEVLKIEAAVKGVYGYLHLGGGIETAPALEARGSHLAAGLGGLLESGTELQVGADSGGLTGQKLDVEERMDGGVLRIVPSLQTGLFEKGEIARFEKTQFTRDRKGNRMGVRLLPEGEGFQSQGGLSVLSEVITPGDVQITGDGTPFVLLGECQTTGGYPRIGTVLPADLPRMAQAQPGTRLSFAFVSLEEAVEIERKAQAERLGLRKAVKPLIRNPHEIPDLLSYQLISGVTAGQDGGKAPK